MVATSNCGAASAAPIHSSHRDGGSQFGVGCSRAGAEPMGISAIAHTGAGQPRQQASEEATHILSGLIEDLVATPFAESERLLIHYGSLSKLYQWCVEHDAPVEGAAQHVSKRLHHLARLVDAAIVNEVAAGPVISDFNLLVKGLTFEMAGLPREVFRVLFLNAENRLVSDQVMWEGSVRGVQVHPREVVRRAIETAATAVIFAHNHPSGDPTPSHGDYEVTKKLVHACASVDVVVHDHIIVAGRGYVSMRASGLPKGLWKCAAPTNCEGRSDPIDAN
jgi:DNA repair protein RadC